MEPVEGFNLYAACGGGQRISWCEWKKVSKNYGRVKYNYVKDYIGAGDFTPTFAAEYFRRRFSVPWNLYKEVTVGLLNHVLVCGETRMIEGTRPEKPKAVKLIIYLNMLSSWKSGDGNDEVAYMADETGK